MKAVSHQITAVTFANKPPGGSISHHAPQQRQQDQEPQCGIAQDLLAERKMLAIATAS